MACPKFCAQSLARKTSIEYPTGSSFRKALFDKPKYTGWANTVEGFRTVTAAHSILAERCWFHLLPDGFVCDQLGDAFQNHGLGSILRADDTVWIFCQVACLLRLAASAEPECPVEPQAPDDHGMGPAIGPHSHNPVLARLSEGLHGPLPGQQSGFALTDSIIRNLRSFGSGHCIALLLKFRHGTSDLECV